MNAPIVFKYLMAMDQYRASDLYLTVGKPPILRTEEGLKTLEEEELSAEAMQDVVSSVLTSRQRYEFDNYMELNTSLDMGQHGRFRINVLRQKQSPAMVVRRIVTKIPSFEELRLPPVLEKLSMEKRGLVLLTGVTGSGKSTTLASMVDNRNNREAGHIITIEDPIEYFHDHKKSVITQREVGVDTQSFSAALKNALRQRPDVILVGEIREREVMEQALSAAETGHLCLATIHTNNAYQAIERIVNFFPEDYAPQIRLNLSMNLKAIVSQRLLPSVKGGMVPATEVMMNQGLIRELIENGHIKKIRDVMAENTVSDMHTFDQSLFQLFEDGLISEDIALKNSDQAADLKIKIRQLNLSGKKNPARSDSQDAVRSIDTSVISLND